MLINFRESLLSFRLSPCENQNSYRRIRNNKVSFRSVVYLQISDTPWVPVDDKYGRQSFVVWLEVASFIEKLSTIIDYHQQQELRTTN